MTLSASRTKFVSSMVPSKHVPLCKKFIRTTTCPWFSSEINTMIAEREYLYLKYCLHKTPENRKLYTTVRNKVTTKVRAAKRVYYMEKLNMSMPSKMLWRNLRHARVFGEVAAVNTLCPDELNSYFVGDLQSPVVSPQSMPLVTLSDQTSQFGFRGLDSPEILNAIFTIKSNAVGPDGMSPRFVKLIAPFIIAPLAHFFNSCITKSTFPMTWKLARHCYS